MLKQLNLVALAFALVTYLAMPVQATPLVSVDFNQTAAGATQAGFQVLEGLFPDSLDTFTNSVGAYTWTVDFSDTNGSHGFFNRGSLGAVPYKDLYNDFAATNTPGDKITLTISGAGVAASTDYFVTLYSYDDGNSGGTNINTYTPNNGSVLVSGTNTITYTPGNAPTATDTYATTIRVKSSGAATLSILASSNLAFLRVNGFELSAVPEPSGVILAMCGLCGIARCARRRKTS